MKRKIRAGFCQHLNKKRMLKRFQDNYKDTHSNTGTDTALGIDTFKTCRKLNRSQQFSEKSSPYIIKSSVLTIFYFLNLIKKLYYRTEETSMIDNCGKSVREK